jgi:hypothetical protein
LRERHRRRGMDATRDLRCDPIFVQQKSFSIDALEGEN